MEFEWVTRKSGFPLVLVFSGVPFLGGCQTTESEDGPVIQLFSADQYNIFWDQGDHLAELVEQEKFDDAAKLYASQTELFRRKTTKKYT